MWPTFSKKSTSVSLSANERHNDMQRAVLSSCLFAKCPCMTGNRRNGMQKATQQRLVELSLRSATATHSAQTI